MIQKYIIIIPPVRVVIDFLYAEFIILIYILRAVASEVPEVVVVFSCQSMNV